MAAKLNVAVDAWNDGDPIPEEYGFCAPADEGYVTMGPNRSPAIRWSGAPDGTRSYAVVCNDPDAPSVADDVNQEGRTIPADLPRVDFCHWVLVDVPAGVTALEEGADSDGVTPGGKPPGPTAHGVRGINRYTEWFAGDEGMAGDYGGYDGPCPPWNDAVVHRYVFTVYALDVETLGLSGTFGRDEALAAMEGHVLAEGSWTGTYTLNPDLR